MGAALSARSTLSQLQALIRLADNGVLNIQLNSRLQGREALGVMVDGTDAMKGILGVEFERKL